MSSRVRLAVLAAVFGIAAVGGGVTWAQDPAAIIDQRQEFMKAQGRYFGAVRAFTEDKADLAAARAAGAELVRTTPQTPGLFPQGTGMDRFPGKSFAKPEIWAQWDRFNEVVRAASARANELNAALQTGDKAAITAAFQALGRDGCTGCHQPFRQPKT